MMMNNIIVSRFIKVNAVREFKNKGGVQKTQKWENDFAENRTRNILYAKWGVLPIELWAPHNWKMTKPNSTSN